LTTTTANAGRVMQHINYACQILWPGLDVAAVSVTEQWSQFAVAGPASRALLQSLLPEHDLANAAFPFMSAVQSSWRGVPMRLFRVSFSGELAYEIGVPADYGTALIQALMAAGETDDVAPYGTEALGVLRIEKGHAAGGELNGQTTAGDLGLGGMMSSKKDFIGRVMAGRPGLVATDRPVLVGIKPIDHNAVIRSGAHLLEPDRRTIAAHDLGHVTSSAWSPTLGHSIGLALVSGGRERMGQRLRLYDPVRNGDMPVELCSPIFYDPEGAKVRG
jgi:sarcosine oxidase subunit alpha